MTARQSGLDETTLREQLAQEVFAAGTPGDEHYALQVEALPLRWGSAVPPGPVPLEELQDLVAAWGATEGTEVYAAGPLASEPARACIGFGPGGQLKLDSGQQATPAAAWETLAYVCDGLERALGPRGIELLSLGWDPLHEAAERPWQDPSDAGQHEQMLLEAPGGCGSTGARLSASTRVRIAFGGPARAALRWRAAQLLAPLFTAIFSFSPLTPSGSARCKSLRSRTRSMELPSRVGFPAGFRERPESDPMEQYLAFALRAKVTWIRRNGRAMPLSSPVPFAHWLQRGIDGTFPDLGDWREHLEHLSPEVRPRLGLELHSADAQARPFRSVPLALWSALLCDDVALGNVVEGLAGREAASATRWELAAGDGLLDPTLADEARWIFGLAADALMRAHPGWVSRSMLASFVAFGQHFAQRGRSPADDLLDLFLEHGRLEREGWLQMVQGWCLAAAQEPLESAL